VSHLRLVSIVDDEPDITNLFKDALTIIANIRIFTFTDPVIALEHFTINKGDYAVIISDLGMPALNGMELIKNAKTLNPFTRMILMTAFDIDDAMFEDFAKKQIINGFLQKPVKIDDLCAKVNEELDLYEIGIQKPIIIK
jgi:DNA-binding NtrC family response regulator